jgi:hypothetical protein
MPGIEEVELDGREAVQTIVSTAEYFKGKVYSEGLFPL